MNKHINIHDAKTNLSKYLQSLKEGDVLTICKHNIPVAEVRPIPKKKKNKRPIGLARGKINIPDNFNDPLPDEILDLFYKNPLFPSK